MLLGSVGGQGDSGRGGEVPGRFRGVLKGPLESFIFFLLDMHLSMVQRNIDVFSLGSFCEADGGFLVMLLFQVFKFFLLQNSDLNMLYKTIVV